jgi:hypothetical protein
MGSAKSGQTTHTKWHPPDSVHLAKRQQLLQKILTLSEALCGQSHLVTIALNELPAVKLQGLG